MTLSAAQTNPAEHNRATYDAMSSRCAELSIQVWHCDAAGNVLIEPNEPASPKSDVERVAKVMCHMPQFQPLEVAAGHWAVAIEEKQNSRRIALNIAVVKAAEASEAKRIGTMLQWNCDDAARVHHDQQTIEQFSEELAQAYEETNLLYRMARMLNCGDDPVRAVETIGSQLQEVLPFAWLAIRFNNASQGVRGLSDKTIIAGEPPCGAKTLTELSDPLLEIKTEEGWNRLLNPQNSALAAATGAEVLAEPITHDSKVIGVLMAGNKSGPDAELSSFEMQFLDATADFLGVFHENLSRFAEQQELFFGTLRALTASIDAKDRYTRGHSERVGLMASKMAKALGMDKKVVEQYRIAGLVHDVGKIGVPEAVLTKPGRLTDEEFNQIKLHPGIGYTILKDIPAFEGVLPGVLSHHERWDGKGYPNNIAGEQIPMIARVLALADTFDAMSSNRSYRPAMPRARVLEEILRCGGTQFDPQLAPLFVTLDFTEFDRALESHRSLDQRAA